MQLIQFNVYYTVHSNTNNNRPSNNLLVIDFMLLIQFMLLITDGFCDRDLRRQAAATTERLWTEARRAEDRGLQRPGSRPEGPTMSGDATLIKSVQQNKLSRRRRRSTEGPTISSGATPIKLVCQNKLPRRCAERGECRRHENGGATDADGVQSCL